MEAVELLKIVRRKADRSIYSKGAKMLINDPSIYYCFNGNLGSAREAFVVFALSERYEVFASSREEDYDYLVDGRKIEVGGKHKSNKSADCVVAMILNFPCGTDFLSGCLEWVGRGEVRSFELLIKNSYEFF